MFVNLTALYFSDHFFLINFRPSFILFASIMLLGISIFAVGGAYVSYITMLIGRFIYGIGGECSIVALSSIIS